MGYHPSDDSGGIGRRGFLGLTGAAVGATAIGAGSSLSPVAAQTNAAVDLDALSFYSPASQIAADGESELADDDHVVVWAPPGSVNFETTDDGPTTVVYEENPIPLVSEDGPVVGFGSVDLVSDNRGGFDLDNEEFLLNVFDEKLDGSGTVLWDEGHDQFGGLALSNYNSFDQYAANAGYDLTATANVLGTSALRFPSTASQVAPDGESALTDPEHAVVWAEPTAENVDEEGDGAYIYGDDGAAVVETDADGEFTVSRLAAGSYEVTATAQGAPTSDPVTVDIAADETAELALFEPTPEPGTVSGVVTDADGEALTEGTWVRFSAERDRFGPDKTVQLGVDGAFEFGGVAPGSYDITAETLNLGETDEQKVNVAAGGTTSGVEISYAANDSPGNGPPSGTPGGGPPGNGPPSIAPVA